MMSREVCKRCGNESGVGFTVPDELWAAVSQDRWNILCVNCFVQVADALRLRWDTAITFYPMALASLEPSVLQEQYQAAMTTILALQKRIEQAEADFEAATARNLEAEKELTALKADLARVSEELGLPPTIGPAPGELKRRESLLQDSLAEVERLKGVIAQTEAETRRRGRDIFSAGASFGISQTGGDPSEISAGEIDEALARYYPSAPKESPHA